MTTTSFIKTTIFLFLAFTYKANAKTSFVDKEHIPVKITLDADATLGLCNLEKGFEIRFVFAAKKSELNQGIYHDAIYFLNKTKIANEQKLDFKERGTFLFSGSHSFLCGKNADLLQEMDSLIETLTSDEGTLMSLNQQIEFYISVRGK